MASHQPPSTRSLISLGCRVVFATITRLITAPFRWNRRGGAPIFYKDVFFSAIRAMLSTLTIAQSRYINKSTADTYAALCKEINQKPKTLCRDNATAHWIGKEDADVVILYLHGGGYTQPCTLQHMQYLHRLVKDINGLKATSISVLLLGYTLAPEAQFPTQLKQAVSMLSYLLDGGRSASDIMIAGDSAGGGLALSLFSHLLHPHLDIPKIELQTLFRGAFLYSPWVSFDTNHESFTRNAEKDVLVPNMLRKWAGIYLGTVYDEIDPGIVTGGNNYSEPLLGNLSWWQGMHKVAHKMWIFAGEDEVFIDSLHAFGEKFLEGWKAGGGKEEDVVIEFVKNEPHIGPIMDVMLQYTKKSKTQLDFEGWLKARLA